MNCRKCQLLILPEKQLFREGSCADACGACQMLGLARFVEMDEPEDTPLEIHQGEQAGAAMRDCAEYIREETMDAEFDQWMKEYDAGLHPLSEADKAAIDRITASITERLGKEPFS